MSAGDGRFNHSLSRDDIGNQGRMLMMSFIHERLSQDHVVNVPAIDELQEPGTPTGPPLEHMKEIARALRCIADEIDQDHRIQKVIDKVPPGASQSTFLHVANDFFQDGVFSWGRVATLFYFGYKMVLKALDKIPLVRTIINWVITFLVDKVAPWIIARGGWEAIVEYFGTPGWQVVGILLGGMTIAGAVVLYKSWRP